MTSENLVTIVEDDPDIMELLKSTLKDNGFDIVSFSTARDFRNSIGRIKPKVNLIDLGLPDQDGMTLVRELSYSPNSATIIITGRQDLSDKIVCLELGADDYILKPFEPKELIARLRSVLRRIDNTEVGVVNSNIAHFEGYTMNFDTYELFCPDGTSLSLSRGEANVLKVFLSSPNRLLSRDSLMGRANVDIDRSYDRCIDVRISRIRGKIEKNLKRPKLIKTVYGAGYLFAGKVDWER